MFNENGGIFLFRFNFKKKLMASINNNLTLYDTPFHKGYWV